MKEVKGSKGLVALIIIVIGVSLWAWDRWPSSSGVRTQDNQTPSPLSETTQPSPAATPATPANLPRAQSDSVNQVQTVKPQPSVATPVTKLAPSLQALRQQVSSNPHDTPQALVEFSVALSEKMRLAFDSEPEAGRLMGEFEECALGPDLKGNSSVQALCILNARRLQLKYTSLASRYQEIQTRSDPRARELMQAAPE